LVGVGLVGAGVLRWIGGCWCGGLVCWVLDWCWLNAGVIAWFNVCWLVGAGVVARWVLCCVRVPPPVHPLFTRFTPHFLSSSRFFPCFPSFPPRLQADSKTERLRSEVLAAGGLWRDVGRMPETGERLCWFVGSLGWRWLGGVGVCDGGVFCKRGRGGGQLKGQASCPHLRLLLPLMFAPVAAAPLLQWRPRRKDV
jgi:hypothetical protein